MTLPDSEESARVGRLNRVSERAVAVLGNLIMAFHWLRSPNPALSGKVPLALVANEAGTHQVLDLLARIERGEVRG
jgi:putative toxin-antitoxin system antitoxin component (TIGR02293 family)